MPDIAEVSHVLTDRRSQPVQQDQQLPNPHRKNMIMTIIDQPANRNGVDTATLFATLDAVRDQPETRRLPVPRHQPWISGTHNRTTINGYYGAGQEHSARRPSRYDADHPPVLVGKDNGPTPVEHLLHALAACLTSGLANIAAARGIDAR